MYDDELTEEEERKKLFDQARDLVGDLYSVLCSIDAPDGFLDDLDKIEDWLNL